IENRSVGGSIPPLGTIFLRNRSPHTAADRVVKSVQSINSLIGRYSFSRVPARWTCRLDDVGAMQ
ncbi:MAG: hypothetical protein NTU64_10185, partial [Hyphomicrobiales bacterium]|nr:hypothetical protein [Hyphomicrobiales bacterium]